MRPIPTPGSLILTDTLKNQSPYGFTGGGKFMDLFMRSSLKEAIRYFSTVKNLSQQEA